MKLENLIGADIILAIIKSFGPLEIIPWYALFWGLVGILFMGAIEEMTEEVT